jgi:hypothetical protein
MAITQLVNELKGDGKLVIGIGQEAAPFEEKGGGNCVAGTAISKYSGRKMRRFPARKIALGRHILAKP